MTEVKNITAALYEAARRREGWSRERGEALVFELADSITEAETEFNPFNGDRCEILFVGEKGIACIWTELPLIGIQRDYVSQIQPLLPEEVVTFVFDDHGEFELGFEEAAFKAAFPRANFNASDPEDEPPQCILNLYFFTVVS